MYYPAYSAQSSHRSTTPQLPSHRASKQIPLSSLIQGKENEILIAMTGRIPKNVSPNKHQLKSQTELSNDASGSKVKSSIVSRKSSLACGSSASKEHSPFRKVLNRKQSLQLSKPAVSHTQIITMPSMMNTTRTSAIKTIPTLSSSTKSPMKTKSVTAAVAALNKQDEDSKAISVCRPLFHKSGTSNSQQKENLIAVLMSDRSLDTLSSELQKRITSCSRERQEQQQASQMSSTTSLLKTIQNNLSTQQPTDVFRSSLRNSTAASLRLFSEIDGHQQPHHATSSSKPLHTRNSSLSSFMGTAPRYDRAERFPLRIAEPPIMMASLTQKNSIETIFRNNQERQRETKHPICVAIDLTGVLQNNQTQKPQTMPVSSNNSMLNQPSKQQIPGIIQPQQLNLKENASIDVITRISTFRDSPRDSEEGQSFIHDFKIDGNYITML